MMSRTQEQTCNKLRLLFISPRPFGLMGTSDTYLLAESYGKFADICLIANREKDRNTTIVHHGTDHITLHEISFKEDRFWNQVQQIISQFSPKVVILENYAKWFDIAGFLRRTFNDLVLVLDIKFPLILDGDEKGLKYIQDQGIQNSGLLDLVMTRCLEDVQTWIPGCRIRTLEYMVAGLVPVAMDKRAHQRYAEKGFCVEFFDNGGKAFTNAAQRVCSRGLSTSSHRKKNLEPFEQVDWDFIASRVILPAFSKLIEKKPKRKSAYVLNIRDRIHMWNIPGCLRKPDRISSSSIRIAGIVGERLYRGIDLECDLLLLTPENWSNILSYTKPDFLLVESTWFTVTNHWYMAQTVSGEEQDLLTLIISSAKEKNIPTVFWMTKGSDDYPHFSRFAKMFDFVFYADPVCENLFLKDGIAAEELLPAVQPCLFHPVQDAEKSISFNPGTLYDGWVDLFRFPEIGDILKRIKGNGLSIFQTRLMMYKKQLNHIDRDLIPFVKGTVPDVVVPDLLKKGSMYLTFEQAGKSRTEKIWDILQATASRIPVAYLGKTDLHDPFKGMVRSFKNEASFCDYVNSRKDGGIDLERDSHKSWRETFLHHVFAKRIQTICHRIGIQYDWEEFPKASLVTGTIRSNLLSKCLEQFESQTYPEKELVLVFNGDSKTLEPYRERYAARKDILMNAVPLDYTVGTVLNYGALKSSGKYFFRIDDDDIYGPNYILDTLLYLRAVKATIFGKRASFFHFEGEPDIYLRNSMMPSIKTFPAKMLNRSQDHLISGCSFGASMSFLRTHRFPDFIQATVDSAYIGRIREKYPDLKCLLTDPLNLIVKRASNVSDHTWRIEGDEIKKGGKPVTEVIEDLIC